MQRKKNIKEIFGINEGYNIEKNAIEKKKNKDQRPNKDVKIKAGKRQLCNII